MFSVQKAKRQVQMNLLFGGWSNTR